MESRTDEGKKANTFTLKKNREGEKPNNLPSRLPYVSVIRPFTRGKVGSIIFAPFARLCMCVWDVVEEEEEEAKGG